MPYDASPSVRHGFSVSLVLAVLAASTHASADYPIASHRYLADPGVLIRDGRIYLYASNDDDNAVEGGYTMASLVCVSSSDLKNWTDHGEVLRVPANASWASNSWAPTVVERNGLIYLYFGNGGYNIGVATSSSPTGTFVDPNGSALVGPSTPGASGTDMWLFDPAIFVDDDGQAYLYFGGNGENNVRVIRINEDMVSVSGSAIALSAPNFFEASWMHKRNGIYYFSYSTSPSAGLSIDYMTSNSPTGGFVHRGTLAAQPPVNGNNNHAGEFEFNGQWYHAYHNRYVATQAGIPTGYRRNLALEELDYDADGRIQPVTYTTDGLPQLAYLDPYSRVEAETMNAQSGVETERCSAGGMNVSEIGDGDWIRVRGVDFGSAGADSFSARVASAQSGGTIELRLGGTTGTLIGTCDVPGTGGWQTWTTQTTSVTGASGVQDLYLVFRGNGSPLFNVDWWQFTATGGTGGSGGGGGTGGAGGTAGAGDTGGAGGTGGGGTAGTETGGAGGTETGGSGGAGGTETGGSGGAGGTETGGSGGTAGMGTGGSGGTAGMDTGGSGGTVGCTDTTYEAETMTHSTGAEYEGGWNLYTDGYISTDHVFSAGPTTITVVALGEVAAGIWPHLQVLVGGVLIGEADVSTTSWQPYPFSFMATAGSQEIRVAFTNDNGGGTEDRNLIVDQVIVGCPTADPSCTDGSTNGAETDVDCGGGTCPACADGQGCLTAGDCTSGICQSGVCGCPAGQHVCGGACVDLQTDAANCGTCGQACAAGQTCMAGVCACAAGLTLCSGTCIDTQSNGANCGACGNACPADQVCYAGACVSSCPAGLQQCGQDCADLASSLVHCGACDVACELPGAVSQCVSGSCAIASCLPGAIDLDLNAANGCEYACTVVGVETCNGYDDDCNGVVDDGLICGGVGGAPATGGASALGGSGGTPTGGSAGEPAAEESEEEGGCGCSVPGRGTSPTWIAYLMAVALIRRRRAM